MSFVVIVYSANQNVVEQKEVGSVSEARHEAEVVVNDRMDAFGEDRDALERYGFIDAEDQAMSIDEDGAVIFMQDGWKIEIIPNGKE